MRDYYLLRLPIDYLYKELTSLCITFYECISDAYTLDNYNIRDERDKHFSYQEWKAIGYALQNITTIYCKNFECVHIYQNENNNWKELEKWLKEKEQVELKKAF